jgi:hypothetical protein
MHDDRSYRVSEPGREPRRRPPHPRGVAVLRSDSASAVDCAYRRSGTATRRARTAERSRATRCPIHKEHHHVPKSLAAILAVPLALC